MIRSIIQAFFLNVLPNMSGQEEERYRSDYLRNAETIPQKFLK